MQAELDLEETPLEIRILGVNGVGYESGNPTITTNRDLPWLQDVADQNVWIDWEVTYRDVIVLDADNTVFSVYNLTDHDLGNPDNYAALKAILIDAATP